MVDKFVSDIVREIIFHASTLCSFLLGVKQNVNKKSSTFIPYKPGKISQAGAYWEAQLLRMISLDIRSSTNVLVSFHLLFDTGYLFFTRHMMGCCVNMVCFQSFSKSRAAFFCQRNRICYILLGLCQFVVLLIF